MKLVGYGTVRLPQTGRYVVAQYDERVVTAYIVCTGDIAEYAEFYQVLQGAPGLNLDEMLWFTPSFIAAAYRSGWGLKAHVLAVTLDRVGFEAILRKAVCAVYEPALYTTVDSWQTLAQSSWVRFLWQADINPLGQPLAREVIHIGLYGKSLRHFANGGWLERMDNLTDFVRDQYEHLQPPFEKLQIPPSCVYPMYSAEMIRWLGARG